MTDEELMKLAKKRVNAKRGFSAHLTSYIAVNAFLVFVWLMTGMGGGYFWPAWVIGGWGIGVLSHAMGVNSYLNGNGNANAVELEYKRLKAQINPEPVNYDYYKKAPNEN